MLSTLSGYNSYPITFDAVALCVRTCDKHYKYVTTFKYEVIAELSNEIHCLNSQLAAQGEMEVLTKRLAKGGEDFNMLKELYNLFATVWFLSLNFQLKPCECNLPFQ